MKTKKKILLFLFATALSIMGKGQQYRFIPFNVSNGLSQNSVHCIYQDRDGLLWIGTQDGLNSFDGRNFKTYRNNPADTNTLSDHFTLTINEDPQGYLWIGTGHGLNRLNKHTGKVNRIYFDPEEKERLTANYNWLAKNTSGEIYIPHYKTPSLINKMGILFPLPDTLKGKGNIVFDEDDNIWTLDPLHGFLYFSKQSSYNKEEKTHLPVTLNAGIVYKLISAENGLLWLYSDEPKSRIFFFDTKSKKWLDKNLQLPTVINHIHISKNGIGWVSTLTGIYLVKDFSIQQHITYKASDANSIPPGSILCSYEDRQGNSWIGSANAGIAYYNPLFNNYQLITTGVDNNAITSSAEVNGVVWLGSADGLYKVKNNTPVQTLFKGKRVSAITKDKFNNLWVGVQNDGLYVLNSNGSIIKTYQRSDSSLAVNRILYLFTDSKNRVFVCTEVGFYVFTDIATWKSFYQRNTKPVRTGWYVLHGFEDDKHNIWLSKHLGVDVLDENLNLKKEIFSDKASAPISRALITGVAQDKNGDMWIGTLRSGIYLYKNETLRQYTTANGLTSNLIYGIQCDDKGRIWATTTNGINVYVPEENRFYSLTSSDGLPADEYVLGSFFKNAKGQLTTGSSKGLITIDANEIELKARKAEAIVNSVLVNAKAIEANGEIFVLKPGFKTIAFVFSVNQSVQPKNILYHYRLLGMDDKWQSLSPDNLQITYTSLPYKKLIMQVRAAYSLIDIETAPVNEFQFEVRPPFWKTTWFRILAGVLLFGLFFFIIQQYNKAKYRKQIQALQTQKELQQERNRISRDLHDNIGAYTSALIAGINQLKNPAVNREENITELNEYASNIMGYLRETIWVLSNEHLTLTAFTDRFKNYATRIVKNYPQLSIRFDVDIEKEKELVPQHSLNLFRILQEALQNACKHAAATEVGVNISNKEKMKCTVTDNGKGITEAAREDSYGLKNMQLRAEEIGFTFTIESFTGKGTTVTLTEK